MIKKVVALKRLFKYLFLIGGSLLYNVVLLSAIQRRESALSMHMSPHSSPAPHLLLRL